MEELLDNIAVQADTAAESIPNWVLAPLILLAAIAAALLLHEIFHRVLIRLVGSHEGFWRTLIQTATNPMRLVVVVVALALSVQIAPLTARQADILHHILLIGFIAIVMWVAQIALNTFTRLHLQRFEQDVHDQILARKHITQMRILQRVAGTVILIVGIGAMLTTFEAVRQYGVSLLASAGAAGIVVGLALQPLLKNLFAGIQLAMTQPIRIGDALIVQGDYGNVEEITSTYVVVRTWDLRRLIVPLNFFIEQPFENWTRVNSALIGIVFLYVDYSVPVSALREKAEEIVRKAPQWDGDTFALQVTNLSERTMEVRILASAHANDVFGLRCEIREQMMRYLAENFPDALPRFRAEMETLPAKGNGAAKPRETERHGNFTGGRE